MNLAQRLKRVAESLLIAIAIAPLSFLVGGGMPAVSAPHSPDIRHHLKQDPSAPPPPYDTIAGGGQWNLWRGIFDSDPPFDSRDGGSRGEGFCIIAPVQAEGYQVASDRPTFVWRGTAEQLEVMRADGSVTIVNLGEVPEGSLTTFELPNNSDMVYAYTYEGEPLPPGLHRWRIQAQGLAFSPWLDFEIVDGGLQSQVVADLAQIQHGMAGDSEEAIALAQANELANQQLWADFWAEILSVEDPSEQLTDAIQELTQNLCDPLPTEPTPQR